jgi:hypothetical protein
MYHIVLTKKGEAFYGVGKLDNIRLNLKHFNMYWITQTLVSS